MTLKTNLYWDGETIRIQGRKELEEWLNTHGQDTWFSIEVSPIGKVNNTSQSRLYHKWCDIVANDLGWDSGDDVHEYLKKTYNSGKTTKGMTTGEWAIYMIKVQAFANSHNINLPTGLE